MAPVRARIASRRVVLPLWKGPTSAMHRGPRGLLTSCPICRLLQFGARPVIGSADPMLRLSRDFGKRENVAALRCEDRPAAKHVIASEATQSIFPQGDRWIASSLSLLAMT